MKTRFIWVLALPLAFAACKNDRTANDYTVSSSKEGLIATGIRIGNEQQDVSLAVAQKQRVVTEKQIVYVNSSSNEAKVTKKKGMSKAAKGAIIGGTTGAIAGGVITKSGKGAVVGGIIGAGTGYIIGRKKDKRDGRVQ